MKIVYERWIFISRKITRRIGLLDVKHKCYQIWRNDYTFSSNDKYLYFEVEDDVFNQQEDEEDL